MTSLESHIETFPDDLKERFVLPFRFVSLGSHELDVVVCDPSSAHARDVQVSCIPVVPSESNDGVEEELERVLGFGSSSFDVSDLQEVWPGVLEESLTLPESSVFSSSFDVVHDPKTAGILDTVVETQRAVDLTAKNSTSLLRAPSSREDFVRGSRKNVPFLPGGLEEKATSDSATVKSNFPVEQGLFELTKEDFEQVSVDFTTQVLFREDGKFCDPSVKEMEEASSTLSSAHNRAFLLDVEVGNPVLNAELARNATKPVDYSDKEFNETFNVPVDQVLEEMAVLDEQLQTKVPKKPEDVSVDPLQLVLGDDRVKSTVVSSQDESSQQQQQKPTKKVEWAILDRLDVSNFSELVPDMAFQYNFELDTFQKEAVVHLERGECVFVAAHTSAGKTVVAEYAIALSQKHLTRTIYTSPIKALSNQKYRDFQKTFGNVGLITGDVQLNPEGSCLIMTTEILRSMLYRGADLIRDVEFLIFDECHYISDKDRGVVWEEVIILLPAHVTMIFLSATVPNTYEFADWVGRVKRKKIHVISTLKRPTPLEHYLWAGKVLHKVVDQDGNFLRGGYEDAKEAVTRSTDKKGTKKQQTLKVKLEKTSKKPLSHSEKVGSELSQMYALAHFLEEKDLLPVVIFVYSKKHCEKAGFGLQSVNLTTPAEKSRIRGFFETSISRLNGPDRMLPQISRIKDLLLRGVGVHHGGILPLVREIIEILFSKGLVKVLFATETFAMGLNMPARSVVFNSLRKHDGEDFRDLLPGEFLQAAGRAGRRGIDKVGTVIIACWHEVPDLPLLRSLVVGKAERLESQFRLTYNQILNLLRVEDFNPFDMMSRSFSESSRQKRMPEKRAMLLHAKREYENAPKAIEDCIFGVPEAMDKYYEYVAAIEQIDLELVPLLLSACGDTLLVSGRVVVMRNNRDRAVIVQKPEVTGKQMKVIVASSLSDQKEGQVQIKNRAVEMVEVDPFESVLYVTNARVSFDLVAILKGSNEELANTVKSLRALNPDKLVPVDPVTELKMSSFEVVIRWERRQSLSGLIQKSECHKCPKKEPHFALVKRREKLGASVKSLSRALSEENLQLMPEFKGRLAVLEQLEYIDPTGVILIKGRVAREINSCDELIATEMIFEGILSELDHSEAIALLSMLVFEESSDEKPYLTEKLTKSRNRIEEIARKLAQIQAKLGLPVTEAQMLQLLKPGLMEVVYEWSRGMTFAEIMTITDVQEGSIVRNIVRLEETCREFKSVARVIGDQALYEKMEAASASIKKDICFCSSLYLTGTNVTL